MSALIAAAATGLLWLIFMRAVLHKLGDFQRFSGIVADYRLMPETLTMPVAGGLAVAEILVLLGLMVPAAHPVAVLLGMALLALYAVAMAINVGRGRTSMECGCGGAADPIGWRLVGRNGMLVLLALPALLASPFGIGVPEAIGALGAAIALFVLYILSEQVLANFAYLRLRRVA